MQLYLESAPYHLETAENGQQAVNLHTAAPFDLIFMDLEMPVLDGYAATRAIRQWESRHHISRPVPILALTAHSLDQHRQRCRQAGCTDFLLKPVRKAAIMEAITRHLAAPHPIDKPEPPAIQPDGERLRPLLPLFFSTSETALSLASQALAMGNLETARIQGHRLKGSARSFGFWEIGLAGEALERAAGEGQTREALTALLRAMELLAQARWAHGNDDPTRTDTP